ncbi:MAG TPA: D-alanyl-D-alanine carboxypeptidase/D-alanyl-D-alanine-endopeptidase [Gaiellaceae bacterium]|nr:D-alanyl-D-alanine carboxypeptidase/D-alanyl-D-alanine-endopeptidase [Gaiellaceae bacterium]
MRARAVLVWLALAAAVAGGTAAPAASPAASPGLASALRAALAAPGVDPHSTAALVVDLRTGETVLAANERRPLAPASLEKLAVSFAALRVLGPEHRFVTDVAGTGFRSGTVWHGNLYLVGRGDPTLRPRDLRHLARRIAWSGIRHVTGRVVGDDSHFDSRRDAPGWKPSFLGIESPPLSALALGGSEVRTADGSARAAAEAFVRALRGAGVTVSHAARAGLAPAAAVRLARDHSPPLRVVVGLLNRESDNLAAELLLKTLGTTVAERGSTRAGATVVRRVLAEAGVPVAGLRIADGSGLSTLDRLSAQAVVGILRAAAADPQLREPFRASLAVAGVSGTLRTRLGARPTRGRVLAKTGTTNRSCALAGFVGRRYAFAVLHNGFPVPYWPARIAQDRFVTLLARER